MIQLISRPPSASRPRTMTEVVEGVARRGDLKGSPGETAAENRAVRRAGRRVSLRVVRWCARRVNLEGT